MRFWFAQIAVFCFVLSAPHAYGRWAVKDDMDFAIESESLHYTVAADGTYKLIQERTIEVLKDSAKASIGVQTIVYSGSSAKVKVVSAETINGANKTPVPPNMIEDKDAGSSQAGFDDQKQVMIVFPDVKIGSKLHYKYEMEVSKVPVAGFFSERAFPGAETYTKSFALKIESDIPLFVKSRDPRHEMVVANGSSGGKHTVSVKNKGDMLWRPIGEPGAIVNPDSIPRVEVSTAQSWADVAPKLAVGFEAVINGKLPPSFEKIAAEAKGKPGIEDKVLIVMGRLAESLNYLGDWRSVGGKFAPREFAAVEATKHADCKDMAAATVAILRAAGVPADVALVHRGEPGQSGWGFLLNTRSEVPDLGIFNHAIVRAKVGGKDLWVDPTNSAAFAKGLREDVADRPALVLAAGTIGLDHTETLKPEGDIMLVEKNVHFGERLRLEADGELHLKGRSASDMTSMSLAFNHNKTNVEQVMLKLLASESLVRWWTMDISPLQTRLVKDMRIPFKYGADGASFLTSAGPAYNLKAGDVVEGLMVLPERETDLYVRAPGVLERIYRFHDIDMIGTQTLECFIKSRWVDATRSATRLPRGMELKERLTFKASLITKTELASPEFAKVQTELNRCFSETAIVFRQKEKLVEPTRKVAANGEEIVTKDLAKRWVEDWMYDSKPVLRAKEFFEKELTEKPESLEAHFWLARAHFLLGHVKGDEFAREHTDQAIEVVDRALAVKPDSTELLALATYLWAKAGDVNKAKEFNAKAMEKGQGSALAHWSQAHLKMLNRDPNGAVASLQKALTFSDKKQGFTHELHHDLGRLLLKELDWRPAEENLKAAVALSPNNARYLMSLGDLYMKQGELAKAEPLFKKAVDIKDNPLVRAYLAGVLVAQSGAYMKAKHTLPKAEEYLRKSLTYTPDSFEAYFLLGKILEARARENRDVKGWKKALEHYERAFVLNPTYAEAKTRSREIKDYLVLIGAMTEKEAMTPIAAGTATPTPGAPKTTLPIAADLAAGNDPPPAPLAPKPAPAPVPEGEAPKTAESAPPAAEPARAPASLPAPTQAPAATPAPAAEPGAEPAKK